MNSVAWSGIDEQDHGDHAFLSYDDVAASGPASRPLDFPAPTVFRCKKVDVQAQDHRSKAVYNLKNVIVRTQNDKDGNPADFAYFAKKKLGKSTYGTVRLCIVLKRRPRQRRQGTSESRQDSSTVKPLEHVDWESTDGLVVIKASEWAKIHSMRGRHLEDPIKEISAMQLMGNYHPNVIGATEVLQDDDCLYAVMPYLSGGDLYGRLLECCPQRRKSQNPEGDSYGFDENQARVWFRHLILCLYHLQKKGVCHRDISLENLILDENDILVLVDHGLCLRVPYSDPCNYGCVTDASAGTLRRLMISQGQGGKLMYAAPEIVDRKEVVDAFAVDLWSAAVVLFVMLVGLAPFKWAHSSDKRFAKISHGGLKDLMDSLDIPLSPEACDLLQGLFWKNPRKRFTLAEVIDHPWVHGKQFVDVSLKSPNKSPLKFSFSRLDMEKVSPSNSCENLGPRFAAADKGRPRLVTPPN